MASPYQNKYNIYYCPICNGRCGVDDSPHDSYWINHTDITLKHEQCPLNDIMVDMNELSYEYYHLFAHITKTNYKNVDDVWNEFITIYETKLKYIIALQEF